MDEMNNVQNVSSESTELIMYHPPYPSNQINTLDREDTLNLLGEVRKLAEEIEGYGKQEQEIKDKIAKEEEKVEDIRTKISGKCLGIAIVILLLVLIIGTVAIHFIVAIILAIVVFFVLEHTLVPIDLKKHADENNANAQKYYNENVVPLKEEHSRILELMSNFFKSGKSDWAIDVVGNDLFYSLCVGDLYDLVKSRRADSLKEALNKYDDTLHKARMEKMQQDMVTASTVAALEAQKQTELAAETRDAAKQTARYTKSIARSLRR